MRFKVDQPSQTVSTAVAKTRKLPFQPLPYILLLPSLAFIFIIEFYPFINGVSFSLPQGHLVGYRRLRRFR